MELLGEEVLAARNATPEQAAEFRQLRRRLREARQRLEDEENRPTDTRSQTDESTATGGLRQVKGPAGFSAPPASRPTPPRRTENVRRVFEEIQQEHDTTLQRLRSTCDPEFDPDRPVPPVSFAEARALVPTDGRTALVQYCLTDDRRFALVITRDDVFALDLPDLASNQGWELADAWYQSYYGGDRHAWEAALPDLLRSVAERAVRPVVDALGQRGLQRLVLAPHKALHLFPLHACLLADDTPVADHYEVVYTPSLSILHRCVGRQRPQPTRLALIENPTLDLPFTAVEGAGLRRLYADATVRRGPSTRRDDLLADAPACHVFHYSGHAGFDPNDPLRSALILENKAESERERWLTLRHVFGEMNLGRATLAMLNGCESGMVKLESTDEYFGLASGFLFAGATCVLSTPWAVYDLSSALLSLRFHQEWLGGQRPGAALASAQRWLRGIPNGVHLRDVVLPELLATMENEEQRNVCCEAGEHYATTCAKRPPFASPVHWAPFTASGLTYELR